MSAPGPLTIGLSGARHNGALSACEAGTPLAACELERITRVRRARLPQGHLPHDLLDVVLHTIGRTRDDVDQVVVAEPEIDIPTRSLVRVDHHRAHASAAFDLSPFDRAAVLICDRQAGTDTSVWTCSRTGATRVDFARGFDIADRYVEACAAFGFPGQPSELEALARLGDGRDAGYFSRCLKYRDGELETSADWLAVVASRLHDQPASLAHRARVAAAFQQHVGDLIQAIAADVRRITGERRLCLGGGLFYNTFFTTCLSTAGVFDEVFTAPNPGNAGLAIGAVLAAQPVPRPTAAGAISPFLGPEYGTEAIKATLDNCKLSYEYVGEQDVTDLAVDALTRGQLVGWFQGRMEWSHRALGHRSILANPSSPYVLDNLNTFLKRRPRHRTYGVAVPTAAKDAFFDGPPTSSFMEYEYTPRDPDRFRNLMPDGISRLRVQTVGTEDAAGRFDRLLHAFGAAAGAPVLVNTSFNGLHEPMVCSPRHAIRVFFSTGLDLLVLDRFIVRK